jgi:hypothetical protein
VKLLVMIIPSPADLMDNYDFCAIDRGRYPDYDPHRLTQSAEDAARGCQVPSINLFESFAKEHPERLYFRGGDNHWNDEGQRTAAEIVAPQVVKLLDGA